MPVFRMTKQGEGEGATLGVGDVAVPGAPELTRLTRNITLADHIGKFVAGQVVSQFQNEDLADLMKGKSMIMISASWG